MSDDRMIEDMAKRWIELGGDAEGILWCWKMIYEKVKELESKTT